MTWRLRAALHFTDGSGMAAWAEAQLAVRLTHDHDPNRQQANEEASHITRTGDTLTADLFLATEALALDTFATLTAASVTAWVKPDGDPLDGGPVSFVDAHACGQGDPPTPCPAPTHVWTQAGS